jgi:GrpB-like predicted nucleotidyltransferase (UPF0157 family)
VASVVKPRPHISAYDRDGLIDHLEIAPYDPAWAAAFEAERDRLSRALGSLARRIDHNGSTAVPGLAAKPVIDIQLSVDALQPLGAYGRPLGALGYTHVPHADDAVCPFFHRPQTWPHTHHLHVVQHGGDEERRTLAFRDYLRDHANVMGDYAALKQRLAPRYSSTDPSAREAYADAKTEFIERIIQQALAAGYPHPS